MSSVALILAWHALGLVGPPSPGAQDDSGQARVLVRITDPQQERRAGELKGVHVLDAHGRRDLAWTHRQRYEELMARGAPLEMQDAELQAKIDNQMRRLRGRVNALAHDWLDRPEQWLADYRKQDEINQALRFAASTQQDLALEDLGQSLEGRSILGLSVPGHGALGQKRILVMGTQHAREWLSPMACMTVLRRWLETARANPTAPRPALTVVPVVNPDGYVFSWEQDRLWRKNRRPAPQAQTTPGVDLNRNWGHNWGDAHGASDHPSDDAYHGTGAFSEPETQAVRDFVRNKRDVAAMLDVHTFGQWVIYPGSCREQVSWGQHEFPKLADHMAARITRSAGADYSAVSGTSFSYPACGDAADWFAETQRSYAFTVELRPGPSSDRQGFIQPATAIAPTGKDLIAAVEDLRAWVSGEPLPELDAPLAGYDPVHAMSACSMGPWPARSPFSLGALCCVGVMGRKRTLRRYGSRGTQ